jgi:hypothetical protein
MAEKDNEEKKIIIDEDWKTEAHKEQEVLKEEEKIEHEATEHEQEQAPLPEANFEGFISMITTQAYYALGLLRTEDDKDRPPDLDIAKYNIDMLGVIEEKTKGNLTDEEAKMLEGTLSQLRMIFVKVVEEGE